MFGVSGVRGCILPSPITMNFLKKFPKYISILADMFKGDLSGREIQYGCSTAELLGRLAKVRFELTTDHLVSLPSFGS